MRRRSAWASVALGLLAAGRGRGAGGTAREREESAEESSAKMASSPAGFETLSAFNNSEGFNIRFSSFLIILYPSFLSIVYNSKPELVILNSRAGPGRTRAESPGAAESVRGRCSASRLGS